MKDEVKTAWQPVNELAELPQQNAELLILPTGFKAVREALRESEEWLRLAIDAVPVLISYVDSEQRYRFNNKAYEEWFGHPRATVEGKHVEEVLGKQAYQKIRVHIEAALAGRKVFFEDAVPYKNGGTRYIEATYVPHFGVGGKVKGFFALVRDITRRKQAEDKLQEYSIQLEEIVAQRTKQLQESHEELRSIFESVTDGIVVTDLNGIIVDVNERVLQLGRFDAKNDLVGLNALQTIAPRDRERALADMQKLARRGVVRTEEYTLTRADGSEYPAEISAGLLKGADDNPVGFVSVVRDITERKKAEEELKHSREELHSLSTYLQYVKEEVGKPLTPLQQRFAKSGFQGFDDREVFELFMSLCPYRKQMMAKQGERCLKAFKNIRELISASPCELKKAGLAPECMFYIKLLRDMPAQVLREKIMERPVFQSSQEIFDYLHCSMRDLKQERFKVIYLDNRDRIIDIVDLFEGVTGRLYVHPRKVIEDAIEHSATALIFVHNHPSGDPTPSKTDKRLTRDLVFVGNILQIRVLDHIIIGENGYFSFADEGLIQKYEDDFLNIRIRRI